MYSTIHRTFAHLARIAPLAAWIAIAGCAFEQGETAPEAEDTGTVSAPIVDGTTVSSGSLLAKSTVGVLSANGECTGVIIGPRHVLTAAHCKPIAGATVKFYNGPFPIANVTRKVIDVDMRAGVNPFQNDLTDLNGKFADIALLELDAVIPSTSLAAELPLSYPGNNVDGYIVGRGRHDSCNPAWTCIGGQPNELEELRYFKSHTYSSDNDDGHFLVDDPNVNKGDSGGPFYTYNSSTGRMRVHGVLFGSDLEWGAHAKYTSVEFHLSWILGYMGYTGGMTVENDVDRPGSTYGAFLTSDWRRCALACAQDAQCDAYSHWDQAIDQCFLKSSVPSPTALSFARSGVK